MAWPSLLENRVLIGLQNRLFDGWMRRPARAVWRLSTKARRFYYQLDELR
ncbi:hypothetical protein [Acidovorax sp. NO-1]|jgi:hypothetical protein|nr:hypothetical protein [Acidovorax sp. NO-1]